MTAAILGIGTAVPPHAMEQEELGRWMSQALASDPALAQWIQGVYERSGIERRHTCLGDPLHSPAAQLFAPGRPASESPRTSERMAIYRRESVELGSQAARLALEGCDLAKVTHLIAVSCTGFFAPSLDLAIARRLGLSPNVRRTMVGFMGCAATFNALRLADEIVAGAPDALVLVVSVELCTLHLQPGTDREGLVAASLFADGASAALVGRPDPARAAVGGYFELDRFLSRITPDTSEAMVWEVGDHGFALRLSPRVPNYLGRQVPGQLAELFGEGARPAFWAIHPGGRAIIDRLADVLGLTEAQVGASRSVLRSNGNLSSATILFVLAELARQMGHDLPAGRRMPGVAMAFGPGLVTEMAALTYVAPVESAAWREEEQLAHLAHR